MRKTIATALTLALAGSAAASSPAVAQRAGLGFRAGTFGLGADVGVALNETFVARGGIGMTPFEPGLSLGEIDVTADLPTWYNIGLDVYLNGAMRFGAGVLIKPSDGTLSAVFTEDQEIGGQTFTPAEIGTLIGVIDSRDQAPFVLIGFGKHTTPGTGLYVDFGVAFMGPPDFTLDAVGGTLDSESGPLRDALDQEAQEFEDDAGSYLRFWPILNLGIRVGIG
jgi:hypothetical protein